MDARRDGCILHRALDGSLWTDGRLSADERDCSSCQPPGWDVGLTVQVLCCDLLSIALQRMGISAMLMMVHCSVMEDRMVQGSSEGIGAIWVLANASYAGMKAQGHRSILWRVLVFIFGFPGTFISFLAIQEGSEMAYGVELPRRRQHE